MANEAQFTVAGYVATQPNFTIMKTGLSSLSMRVGWTPRRLDRSTGAWEDGPTCFVSVKCYGRVAENAKASLDKGDPVLVTGTLRMHEYESKEGLPRLSVDIMAAAIGHDLSRGITRFSRIRPKGERAEETDAEPAAEPDAAADDQADGHLVVLNGGAAEPHGAEDAEIDGIVITGEDADEAAEPAGAPS